MKMTHWDKASILTLIASVKARPALWDQDNCLYNDREIVDKNWREISEIVGRPVTVAKTRWKGLRDVYRAELKREFFAERMNVTRKRRGKWMPYNHMAFLQSQMILVPEDEETTDKLEIKLEEPPFVRIEDGEDPLSNFGNSREFQNSANHPSSLISDSLSEDQSFSLNGDESNQDQQVKLPELNNHYDDNYHFLISLVPHMKKLSDERQMSLRMKLQELVYEEVYKKSD